MVFTVKHRKQMSGSGQVRVRDGVRAVEEINTM